MSGTVMELSAILVARITYTTNWVWQLKLEWNQDTSEMETAGMKPRHKCRHMKWNEVTNTLFSFQLQVAETLCTAAQQKLTSEGESRSTWYKPKNTIFMKQSRKLGGALDKNKRLLLVSFSSSLEKSIILAASKILGKLQVMYHWAHVFPHTLAQW